MQETITEITRVPLTSKSTGKPFTSLRMKVASRGDALISGFGNKSNEHWKVGDSVNILIEQKGQYLNFTQADSKQGQEKTANAKIEEILTKVSKIDYKIDRIIDHLKGNKVKSDYPQEDVNPNFDIGDMEASRVLNDDEEIPF